jgi:hypothetical protein
VKELNTTLLREKFELVDTQSGDSKPVVALSNRIEIALTDNLGKNKETFILRAQNMHSCVRMAARLIQARKQSGPIMSRPDPFDWDNAWGLLVNDFERRFNPQRWIAVYNQGKCIFSEGEYHPFLDVIEKCDYGNDGVYDEAVPLAENAFKQTGKAVSIHYDGNVALVVNLEKNKGRSAIILRGPDKTTTFNFTAQAHKGKTLNMAQTLAASAAYLEGLQMAFMVGMNQEKIRRGDIERFSEDEKKTREGKHRLSRLISEISNFEESHTVNYRPEKPNIQRMVLDAEAFAQKVLPPKN